MPAEGSRRERVTATQAELARAFERIVEDAPDQWWAVFFPIWPDLEADATAARAEEDAATTQAATTTDAPEPDQHVAAARVP